MDNGRSENLSDGKGMGDAEGAEDGAAAADSPGLTRCSNSDKSKFNTLKSTATCCPGAPPLPALSPCLCTA